MFQNAFGRIYKKLVSHIREKKTRGGYIPEQDNRDNERMDYARAEEKKSPLQIKMYFFAFVFEDANIFKDERAYFFAVEVKHNFYWLLCE